MRISAAAAKWPFVLVGLAGFLSFLAPAAVAGLATTDFALNFFGPDAGRWRGSAAISAGPVPIFGDEVEAVVEWAAFAPGKFQLYLDDEHPGAVDPSAAGEVVYAYEVVSITTAVPGISGLTVGIDDGDLARLGSVSPTSVPGTGGVASSSSFAQPTQMVWNFEGASLLDAGEKSQILVFSSIFLPELDTMQLHSGLAFPDPQPLVASISDRLFEFEIPEPASFATFMLGSVMLLAGRRNRQ